MGGTGPFGADHAGADGLLGSARPAEERAFSRRKHAPQDIAATAPGRFTALGNLHREDLGGVETGIVSPELEPTARQGAKAAPIRAGHLKDLCHGLLGIHVPARLDRPDIGVGYRRASLLGHLYQGQHRTQDVQWLEPGDGARNALFLWQETPGIRADDRGHVTRADDTVQCDFT